MCVFLKYGDRLNKTSRDRFAHKNLLHNIIEVLCKAVCHSSLVWAVIWYGEICLLWCMASNQHLANR